MAWELRKNGKRYFYTAKRVDGKVVKKYWGRGEAGLMAALTMREVATKRKENKDVWANYFAELWPLEKISKLAKTASLNALYAAYLIAGYKRTKCHHWVRTKDSKMDIPTFASVPESAPPIQDAAGSGAEDKPGKPENTPSPPPKSYWPQSIDETIKLVMSGRRDLLEVLRSQLADVPDLWKEVSDLTRVAIQGWANKIAHGQNVAFQESIVLSATTERAKLLEECSTIMERAIVDRWTINKLQLAYFDIVVSGQDAITSSKTTASIDQRHRSAQHQFRESTRQLQKIKMLVEEITPEEAPAAVESVALKLHDPDDRQARRSA